MYKSPLQIARATYRPRLPKALRGTVALKVGAKTESVDNKDEIKAMFPNTYGMPVVEFVEGTGMNRNPINVGVILSGGQAPGGHNVISGLFDGMKWLNKESKLYGFLMGPGGFVDHKYKELTSDIIDEYRNTGGFDMIGSGRTKLESVEQFEKGYEILQKLDIKALVIIGGDDSNTNAAMLAEYYASKNYGVQVIGCPKTIDGDLKNDQIECSFGFDSATKTYSEIIGNIQRDCNSSRKYYHFIKLMGRSASHITLECGLQCQPTICLVSEEIAAKQMRLRDIVEKVAGIIAKRAEKGINFGTVLVPEGLIEFIPTVRDLIQELNDLLASDKKASSLKGDRQRKYIAEHLSEKNADLYSILPPTVASQLSMERDSHGNVQVSLIETEKLLSTMVAKKLDEWAAEGKYKGKFASLHHFLGYEGRCAVPSNFDADYCYTLGYSASRLIASGENGYMAVVRNAMLPVDEWQAGGTPITSMLNMERRNGELKPVIRKALVDLDGAPFREFVSHRDEWAENVCFTYPGPIQYFGPAELCDITTITLQLEHKSK